MAARFEVAYDAVVKLAPATNGERISYARESAQQFCLLRVPSGAGPHPVVALWLAARRKLAPSSGLVVPNPLSVAGVVSLAGIADLRAYALGTGRGNASVRPLLGGPVAFVEERYALASPVELAPLGVPLRLVHGARDAIVPVAQSEALVAAERSGGGDAMLDVLPRAGHFDLIAPFAAAWTAVERRVLELAGLVEAERA